MKIRVSRALQDVNDDDLQKEIKKFISSLKMIPQMNLTADSYLLFFNSKSKVLASKMSFQDENHLLLFINPKIQKTYIKTIFRFLLDENVNQKCLIIFSKKKLFIFNNKNFIKFLKLIPDYKERNLNIKVLEKSRNSFKYYETILLGIIIDFLDKHK